MALPSAGELREIFAAAREYGVTHLRVGPLEVRLSPPPTVVASPFTHTAQPDGASMLADINAAAPLSGEDPIATIRRTGDDHQRRVVADPLELLNSGKPLLDMNPSDPTQRV